MRVSLRSLVLLLSLAVVSGGPTNQNPAKSPLKAPPKPRINTDKLNTFDLMLAVSQHTAILQGFRVTGAGHHRGSEGFNHS